MHLFRPTTTMPIPHHAQHLTKAGVAIVRWTARGGRKVEGIVLPSNPTRCRVKSPVWHICYRDKSQNRKIVKCYVDKPASELKMADLRQKLARIETGQISPTAAKRGSIPISKMVEEWLGHLGNSNYNSRHIRIRRSQMSEILTAGRVHDIQQIDTNLVSSVLKSLRTSREPGKILLSNQTSNHYLAAVKAFLFWCMRSGYIDKMPLVGMSNLPTSGHRTSERRPLSKSEITSLINATQNSNIDRFSLTPTDRACLYSLAIYTGFRVKELASLTKKSFDFSNPDCPTVALSGSRAKNKKSVIQPLPTPLVPLLQGWLECKSTNAIWPQSTWSQPGCAARFIKKDFGLAGIPILDGSRGKLDFHALRTTYANLLVCSGVSLASAVKLMRHSDARLTMDHYVKLETQQLADETQKIM